MSEEKYTADDYTVAWASQGHNVVIACLPAGIYGATSAATVAKDLLRTFKSVRFGLMVGIGGGAPSANHDIRLGDVVVSQPSGTTVGVVQYDRGKTGREEHFERTGSLNTPPQVLLAALARLQAEHMTGDSRIPEYLSGLIAKYPKMKAFTYRGESNDRLFRAEYERVSSGSDCEQCDRAHAVRRDARHDAHPVTHYGNIASGNEVIKNATMRDRLSRDLGVLCFEMEAAGLMQDFPCFVIRGICDYADSHKNKGWQEYGAAVAAAFAKEFLSVITADRVLQGKPAPQVVSDPKLQQLVSSTNAVISEQTRKHDIRYENEKQMECHRAFKTSKYEFFKNNNPARVPGTCKWVLEHPQYMQWRQSTHNDLLWISADPGCGKSVLAKSLIDEDLPSASDHTVCYFFFKDNEEQDGLGTALCAVLHQLFGSKPQLLRHAVDAFEKNGTRLQSEVDELWRILLAAAADESAEPVTCVFDALDECQKDSRQKLIRLLTDFDVQHDSASAMKFQLKFFVTSRPYRDIEFGFGDIPSELPSIRLAGEESNADISEEINLVIQQKIHTAGNKLHLDQEVRNALQARLLATPHRTYLWLHLVWDDMLNNSGMRTKKAFLKKIDSLPSTVEDAYEKILSRHDRGRREEVETLLHIVVGARRPLTLGEMDVAFQLATDSPDATAQKDLELIADRIKSDIRQLCGLFGFISDNRIYLIHQTAKEFLVAKEGVKNSTGKLWRHSLRGQFSNQIMMQICVQYLSFSDIPDDRIPEKIWEDIPNLNDFPLLEYSSANWPVHCRDMHGADEGLLNRMFKLYDAQTERFQTWVSIFWKAAYPYDVRSGLQSAHLAALNGHVEVLAKMIQRSQIFIDVQDEEGGTALGWAAEEGQVEVVKLLLDKGADINAQGGHYGNALQGASSRGQVEVAKLLLEKGADVNLPDELGRTPLFFAARYGRTDMVRVLIANHHTDHTAKDWYGATSLCAAVRNGHAEVAELLLSSGNSTVADCNLFGHDLIW
ncbi:hypothetical protein QQZ08_010317 [Neonectria magnoliae]|uniref:Nucleoside phosphorylase domain-containing protein n=1 Tax=Neonectria magnoliae TaxID=2732573 RepID=A0ABR1HHJ7_9HYPO